MTMQRLFLNVFFVLIAQLLVSQHTLSISGAWNVQLDMNNPMIINASSQCQTKGEIQLPGSLAEYHYGVKTEGSDFGILTPEYKYIGKAWYSSEIIIPDSWKDKDVEIFLERVLWESVVFIDGNELSRKDALGTPHIHKLGKLSPGWHQLTIIVDNDMIYNIGDKGHAYGEYTQSIWNGITGRMEMRAFDETRMNSLQIYPNIKNDEIEVRLDINSENETDAVVEYEIVSIADGGSIFIGDEDIQLSEGSNYVNIRIPTYNKLEKWSEFNPLVYILKTTLRSDRFEDFREDEFGFCEVSHDGTKILINDKPVFLRGNLDCVHFPLTGYASCNIDDWIRIFQIYKDYGLNHARFHSWCPPEAAFKAANRVGIYLQAEASIWIDWWMSEDMTLRGRPEMDTKGHPKGLGFDPERDQFVIDEMNRMIEAYGNHPSFTMFCIGNELGNSDFTVMEKWVADLKAKDPRRLYSVSTARTITKTDDFNATHNIQGIGRTRGLNGPSTDWDFEEVYSKMDIPIIAHEIGQWPVYPRWSEIEKYSGVLKARNLEGFKKQATGNGIADQNEDFVKASGALNQIMYKYEIESFLRTKSCAGIQLLSMQDYQGQGEALIGWLDAHWESKEITSPEIFKRHYNTTVPLLRISKFVWTSGEVFKAKALVSHHGELPLVSTVSWNISNEEEKILAKGKFDKRSFTLGSLTNLGDIQLNLSHLEKAQKLTVSLEVDGTDYYNTWNFWVYPEKIPDLRTENIHITDNLDNNIKDVLAQGGKVLLIANELGLPEHSVNINFYPLYWSLTFFPGQGKTTIGLLLKDDHPAFRDFPTSYHSDWQWETISENAKGFILNDLPENYRPIAQPVDDFHRNNKVGSIFEFKIGKGSLLICGYDLNSNLPVSNQLKYSLLHYMSSMDFQPGYSLSFSEIEQIVRALPKVEDVEVPEKYEDAILYVNAAINIEESQKSIPWKSEFDEQVIVKGSSYQVKSDGVWKDKIASAWHGKEIDLQISCPEGIQGYLYVHFQDWNNGGRTGILDFEGRKSKLGQHQDKGVWVKLYVMREDSNDGKLSLKSSVQTGSNLMITKIVLVPE